jgi:hypothetical protein
MLHTALHGLGGMSYLLAGLIALGLAAAGTLVTLIKRKA